MIANDMRPTSLVELKGQPSVVASLGVLLSQKAIPRAMLFSGPKGTGKTSTARIIASELNPDKSGTIEIDAASHNGVDYVRELQKSVSFYSIGWKTIILDEAHAMSPQAFNALLKLLEEPKGDITFILVTTNPLKLPETVVSRLLPFRFSAMSQEAIVSVLTGCETSLDPEVIAEIARHSEGAARNALVLLERVLLLESPTVQDVRDLVGSPNVLPMIAAGMKGDLDSFKSELDIIIRSTIDLNRVINAIIDKLLDLQTKKALTNDTLLRAMKIIWTIQNEGEFSSRSRAKVVSALFVLYEVLASGTLLPILKEENVYLEPDEVLELLKE